MVTTATATAKATATIPVDERRGRAMGSKLHLIATGDQDRIGPVLDWAQARIDELERRWSRFIPTSEVARLNQGAGLPTPVSADTLLLVTRAIEARSLSGGRFDPLLLRALEANGYDRTFVSIKTPPGLAALDSTPVGGADITVDESAMTVTVDPDVGFDPGGIGKGLAADLVAEEMLDRGACGALVNLGGDIRCLGEGPADGAWAIAVGDRVAGVANRVILIDQGGVASSTPRRRRWTRRTTVGLKPAHHLLDPATGRPADSPADLVTVIAGRGVDAEWLATAIAAEGALPSDRSILGDAAVIVTDHRGRLTMTGGAERFLR